MKLSPEVATFFPAGMVWVDFFFGWGNLLRNLQGCVLVHGINILLINLYNIFVDWI